MKQIVIQKVVNGIRIWRSEEWFENYDSDCVFNHDNEIFELLKGIEDAKVISVFNSLKFSMHLPTVVTVTEEYYNDLLEKWIN